MTPLSRSDVLVMIKGAVEPLEEKMNSFDILAHKLFDPDIGIITTYLKDVENRKKARSELRIGIALTVITIILTGLLL